MRVPTLCLILALVSIAGSLIAAQPIPNSISYQGKLTDSAGQIVPDGDYQIQFKLYSTPSGGTPFWTSSQKTVRTSGGVFSTEIEPITPADITNHTDIWLEIVVGDPGIALSPRIKLHSTPFSIRAGELALPYSGSTSTADAVLSITNSGTGSAAQFSVSDPSNSSPALSVSTSGTGPAARFIGTAEMTGFKLTTTPGAGKVLTSDAEGTGTWKDPITYSAGDGLSLSENIFSITPLGINESMLANGSVTAEKLADNSITSEKIQDGSILLADIGSNGASAGHVLKFDGTAWTTSPDDNTTYSAGNGLTLEENSFSIATGGVTSTMLANDSVDSSKIANGTVQFEDLAQGGAAAGQVIKWNGTAWGPAEDEKGGLYTAGAGLALNDNEFSIAPGGVANSMLADNSITSEKIQDGSITGQKIQVPIEITGSVEPEDGVFTASNSGTGYAVKGVAASGAGIVGYSESGTAGIFDQGASNTNPALIAISRNDADKIAIKAEGDVRVVYPGANAGAANRANPIAYAYINSDGTKACGTPNITCELNNEVQRYDITIFKYDGTVENYDGTNFVAIVTPVTSGGTTPNIAVTGASNGKLFVEIWSILNFKIQGAFQIVIYKP